MQEKRKKVILSTRQELTPGNDFIERAEREGIELEKGAVITTEYLERHYDELCKWVNLFTAYPDYYLDIIRPADSEFSLFFYQVRQVSHLCSFFFPFLVISCSMWEASFPARD